MVIICSLHIHSTILSKMPRISSVWDLHKELTNLAYQDTLRPLNCQKDSWWLAQRLRELSISVCEVQILAFRLTRHQYRAIWREMAKEHSEIVSALWAATTDFKKYNCLFNQALRKMTTFLEHFATRAAPYSGSSEDHEFKVLMDNFGAVVDTISIFYERFDCDGRAEILRAERDAGRMHLFGFEKNDPGQPLDLETSLRLYAARYPGEALLEAGREETHIFYHGRQGCGCDRKSTSKKMVEENSPTDSGMGDLTYTELPSHGLPITSFVDDNWPYPNFSCELNYDYWPINLD